MPQVQDQSLKMSYKAWHGPHILHLYIERKRIGCGIEHEITLSNDISIIFHSKEEKKGLCVAYVHTFFLKFIYFTSFG